MTSSLYVTTDGVTTPADREYFIVTKRLLNQSSQPLGSLRVDLQSCHSGCYNDSPEADAIEFWQALTEDEWQQTVQVLLNGVDQGQAGGKWTVDREGIPLDYLTFSFTGFTVAPGDVVSLKFGIHDSRQNTWRLEQYTVPEPGWLAPGGLLLLAAWHRRRR